MKFKFIFLTTALTIGLSLPIFGMDIHADTSKADMSKHDMASMMGAPIVDATVEGLHMKVWLMTQQEHKSMMKNKKHDGMGKNDTSMSMDKKTKTAMTSGTHHIMLELTDAASGKELASANATVLIVSPSNKNSSVDLMPMKSHFGSSLNLDEKGKYQLTISVTVNGATKTKQFQYTVK